MSEHKASPGQTMLEAWADWIGTWIAFPAVPSNQKIILALWCLHTWFCIDWPATAYLHISSDGPGCGKTTLLEVLGALCCKPRLRPTLRVLSVVRDIEQEEGPEATTRGLPTYFFDQVEALISTKVTEEQAILLTGYKRGGRHGVSVGSKQVDFSTYCPKGFASIGDIARDLRDRSIIVRLSYGAAARDWVDAVLIRSAESEYLLKLARQVLPHSHAPAWTPPSWLQGRTKEIYTPLWSVAHALDLDAATMAKVKQGITDGIEFKRTAESRTYRDLITSPKGESNEYGDRLLRDLASVMPTPEPKKKAGATGHLHTVTAIERLKALDGPWRAYQGTGLTPVIMAQLLLRFGVTPDHCREQSGDKGVKRSGYKRDQVLKALAALDSRTKEDAAE